MAAAPKIQGGFDLNAMEQEYPLPPKNAFVIPVKNRLKPIKQIIPSFVKQLGKETGQPPAQGAPKQRRANRKSRKCGWLSRKNRKATRKDRKNRKATRRH